MTGWSSVASSICSFGAGETNFVSKFHLVKTKKKKLLEKVFKIKDISIIKF
jgi:hypothetical protein